MGVRVQGDLSGDCWSGAGYYLLNKRTGSSANSVYENEHLRLLEKTIEAEVIPRLVTMLRAGAAGDDVHERRKVLAEDIDEFTRLLLAHDAGVARQFVEIVHRQGVPLEQISLGLLAPAARQLGVWWEQDVCTFMQVTIGLSRLHTVLRGLTQDVSITDGSDSPGRRVLLIPVPGEQHRFGLCVVAEFMRRARWDVWSEFPETNRDLAKLVRKTWFAVVGISAGSETRVDAICSAIAMLREHSRNPRLAVMVGGTLFNKYPTLVASVGADGTAGDAARAAETAGRLAERMTLSI